MSHLACLRLTCTTLLLSACAPQTGLILEVQGPDGKSSLEVGISKLRLVTARRSYCERWIGDTEASGLSFSVEGRDLETVPATILLEPDTRTDLEERVTPLVFAENGEGRLVGMARFDSYPFTYEEVRKYSKRIALVDHAAAYTSSDGCICAPGMPAIASGSGTGCDQQLPPSFERLRDTAGCELPEGAPLPIGVCDGQTYPGERQNREVPCFGNVEGACRVGRRVCTDKDGLMYDRACIPDGATLPTSTLCDAFAGCEKEACSDPVACLKTSQTNKAAKCKLLLQPMAVGGVGVPCAGGSWTFPIQARTGGQCVATILDGIKQGNVVVGWKKEGATEPVVTTSTCPPTLMVSKVNGEAATWPPSIRFTISIGDQLYDVTLELVPECADGKGLFCDIQ
jgi:hypothetical protein